MRAVPAAPCRYFLVERTSAHATPSPSNALDRLTVGQFSRSQVMRIVLQDFLERTEKQQRKFITSKAFD